MTPRRGIGTVRNTRWREFAIRRSVSGEDVTIACAAQLHDLPGEAPAADVRSMVCAPSMIDSAFEEAKRLMRPEDVIQRGTIRARRAPARLAALVRVGWSCPSARGPGRP